MFHSHSVPGWNLCKSWTLLLWWLLPLGYERGRIETLFCAAVTEDPDCDQLSGRAERKEKIVGYVFICFTINVLLFFLFCFTSGCRRESLYNRGKNKPLSKNRMVNQSVAAFLSNSSVLCVTLATSRGHRVRKRKKSEFHEKRDWSKHLLTWVCNMCQSLGGKNTHPGLRVAACLNYTHVLTTRKGLLRHCPENRSSQRAFINTLIEKTHKFMRLNY